MEAMMYAKKLICQHQYHEHCILNLIRDAENSMKSFHCPQCRGDFHSYLMCYRGESREIPREREVAINDVCMGCHSRFPQDNYIKMMQHVTHEEGLISGENHVFKDRYGCECVLCE